jgi:hypothetical protein
MAEADNPSMIGALAAPQLDADGRLLDDLACRRCGYSLRGLARGGLCPECSTPVGRSIHGDLLEFSDPDWVTRVARGGSALTASIVLIILAPLAATALAHNFGARVVGLALAVPRIVQIAGFWLATEPDPALIHREPLISARRLARYGSMVAAALTITAYLGGARTPAGLVKLLPTAAGSPAARMAAELCVAALSLVAIVALLRYARSLAMRLPDEQLSRQCAAASVALAIILGCKAMFAAYITITGNKPTGAIASSPMAAVNFVLRLATLLGTWWCVSLIFKFRSRLADAASRARELWTRPAR